MDAQYAAAYADLYRNHWWWRVRERILLARIQRLVAGATPARILDVGCGAGLFFDRLAQFGHIEGIESDVSAVTRSGRWSAHIVAGELDDTYRPSAPFDLILMLDVLEHVQRPEALLRRAAEILKPEGRILTTVPAFSWLWTAHDELNHHVRRYTAGELRDLIRSAGLVPLDTSYLFQSLVLPKLVVRAKETIGSRSPDIPRIPGTAVNTSLQAWCWAEHRFVGWLPVGTSVMAIAGRKGSV
jgi:SAM-dependent methyltransferase